MRGADAEAIERRHTRRDCFLRKMHYLMARYLPMHSIQIRSTSSENCRKFSSFALRSEQTLPGSLHLWSLPKKVLIMVTLTRNALLKSCTEFKRNSEGSVSSIFALALVPVVGLVGAA